MNLSSPKKKSPDAVEGYKHIRLLNEVQLYHSLVWMHDLLRISLSRPLFPARTTANVRVWQLSDSVLTLRNFSTRYYQSR